MEENSSRQDLSPLIRVLIGKKFVYFGEVFTYKVGKIVHVYMSHVVRKTVFAISRQQRRRSACASVQSDQSVCCSLPR